MNMVRGKNGDDFYGMPKANKNQNQIKIQKNEREVDDEANKKMQSVINQAINQDDNKPQKQ